jgi:hypothetical protein
VPYVGLEAGQETLPRPVSPFRDNFVGAGAGLISQRAKISARFLSTPPPVFDEASHSPSLGPVTIPKPQSAKFDDDKGLLLEVLEKGKAKLLKELEQFPNSEWIKKELAACERLQARLREMRDLTPQPISEEERRLCDKILAILDRLPAA